MPRTPRDRTAPARRRRRSAAATSTGRIVGQISQIVSANEQLQRQNQELRAENERLRSELLEIGSALGRLSGGPRRGRGRRGAEIAGLIEAKPRRLRKPITDPEVLAKRAQALVKARAARAERLAAAKAEGNGSSAPNEE